MRILCDNTNKQATINIARAIKYAWTGITVLEFYQFLGLLFYMSGQVETYKKLLESEQHFLPVLSRVSHDQEWIPNVAREHSHDRPRERLHP